MGLSGGKCSGLRVDPLENAAARRLERGDDLVDAAGVKAHDNALFGQAADQLGVVARAERTVHPLPRNPREAVPRGQRDYPHWPQ